MTGTAAHQEMTKSAASPNTMDRQKTINNNIRDYLSPHSKRHKLEGFNIGNKPEHEAKKFEIAMNCKRDGLEILLEPILNNGFRPDVLVMDVEPPIAYEIMCSEEMKSIDKKKKAYGDILIIPIHI